jgi:hypothetical protein
LHDYRHHQSSEDEGTEICCLQSFWGEFLHHRREDDRVKAIGSKSESEPIGVNGKIIKEAEILAFH